MRFRGFVLAAVVVVAAVWLGGLLPSPGTGPFAPKPMPPHWQLVWVP